MSTPKDLHVEVDANVVWQLGEELITDADQALLELVKNCYDADAQVARVLINTEETYRISGKGFKGSITIEDDGSGMSLSDIERGWLTISLSLKKAFKEAGKKTKRFHRTPLGDKGLGRLGTMKLGDTIEIITHSEAGKEGYRVLLSWSQFSAGTILSKVPVQVEPVKAAQHTGTRLTIYGLHEPAYWKGSEKHKRLTDSMSSLLSPFQHFSHFRISLQIDGQSYPLHQIGDDLRNGATVRFFFAWTGHRLTCQARLKTALFRGSTNESDEFHRLIGADSGSRFLKFLKSEGKLRFNLDRSTKRGWYLELSEEYSQGDALAGDVEDPGPFTGEIDSFELDSAEAADLFSSAAEYRQYIKRFAGIAVYRDHFAVRVEEDWLRLGQSWTSGKSYYGLKPANTIGYFELSALHNSQLREKSDREGFLDTRAAHGFVALTRQCVGFANTALTDVRRAFIRFRDKEVNEEAKLPTAWTPADAVKALNTARSSAKAAREALSATDSKRKASLVKARDTLARFANQEGVSPQQRRATNEALTQLESVVSDWDSKRAALEAQLQLLKEDHALTSSILNRFDDFKNQVSEVYEAVALGLAAESLAHEVGALLDELASRTSRVMPRAKRANDPILLGYLEAVRATVSSLRKQVSFLDPMLRATREQRSTFSVEKFLREFVDLRAEHMKRVGIDLVLNVMRDFTVRISRGRLQQVTENLCRNSEYWLQRQSGDASQRKQLTIDIESPNIVVSDSGMGIKQSLESSLFEPFVSGKPAGEGRGLGLFISRQLLRRDGCDLDLAPERNSKGRRYRFIISLEAVEQA